MYLKIQRCNFVHDTVLGNSKSVIFRRDIDFLTIHPDDCHAGIMIKKFTLELELNNDIRH